MDPHTVQLLFILGIIAVGKIHPFTEAIHGCPNHHLMLTTQGITFQVFLSSKVFVCLKKNRAKK